MLPKVVGVTTRDSFLVQQCTSSNACKPTCQLSPIPLTFLYLYHLLVIASTSKLSSKSSHCKPVLLCHRVPLSEQLLNVGSLDATMADGHALFSAGCPSKTLSVRSTQRERKNQETAVIDGTNVCDDLIIRDEGRALLHRCAVDFGMASAATYRPTITARNHSVPSHQLTPPPPPQHYDGRLMHAFLGVCFQLRGRRRSLGDQGCHGPGKLVDPRHVPAFPTYIHCLLDRPASPLPLSHNA